MSTKSQSNSYMVRRNGQVSGPYTSAQLRRSSQQNKLRPSDEVCREGASNWTPVANIKSLSHSNVTKTSFQNPTSQVEQPAQTSNARPGVNQAQLPPPNHYPDSINRQSKSLPEKNIWQKLLGFFKGSQSSSPALSEHGVSLHSNIVATDSNYLMPYLSDNGETVGALMSFGGSSRDLLMKKLNARFQQEGDHVKNGGALSPTVMRSLIAGSGVGALALASNSAGQLFVATAAPGTLMKIGQGVGSAVMAKGGGIASQAAFLPVQGAVMSVAAPLIAFQAITTIIIMNEFQKINKQLAEIEKTISRMLKRSEASFVGEILSAASRLDDIEEQFSQINRFSPEMIIRLSLIEDKVNPIFERYQFLYHSQEITPDAGIEDLNFKKNDAYLAVVLSILDLRIDLLRLKLTVQDSPGSMSLSSERLKRKVDHYEQLWKHIGENPEQVEVIAKQLEKTVEEMNFFQKHLTQRGKRKSADQQARMLSKHQIELYKDGNEHVELAQKFSSQIKGSQSGAFQQMDLIYWEDEFGEHCYYTDDLEMELIAAS